MITKPGLLTLRYCDSCGAYWMTRVLEDGLIECPMCHREDSWTVRWQKQDEPAAQVVVPDPRGDPYLPWNGEREAYYSERAERMP